MAAGDFTNLATVNATGIITGSQNDAYVNRLITAASAFLAKWANNPILAAYYSRRLSGLGNSVQVLPDTPILSVSSLIVDGITIAASSDGTNQPGYVFDDKALYLIGGASGQGVYGFTRRYLNVWVDYLAGYLQADAVTIPATPYQVAASVLTRPWGGDVKVAYTSSGTLLTKVATSPTVGQYSVSAAGLYTFAAADTGVSVTISYGAAPVDVEEACIELVLLKFKQNAKINLVGESLTQQSVTYNTRDMTEGVRAAMSYYKRVVPV